MCTPTAIASLALTAAGTATSVAGQRAATKASDQANAAELARQKKLDDKQGAAFSETLAGLDAGQQKAELAKAIAGRQARAVERPAPATEASLDASKEAPAVIQADFAESDAEGRSVGSALAKRKASLGAGQDLQLLNAIKLASGGRDVSMLGNFKRGSAGALPLELVAARESGGGLRTIGDILNAAGMITGAGGIAGAAKNAGKTAAQLARQKAIAARLAQSGTFGAAPAQLGGQLSIPVVPGLGF